MKKILSDQEVQTIRLCHHDFDGLSIKQAALKMGLSQRRIQQLLQSAKRKAPQMFPILTPRQADVQYFISEYKYTYKQIAKELHISEQTVVKTVRTLREKGAYIEKRKPTIQLWVGDNDEILNRDHLDDKIIQKF